MKRADLLELAARNLRESLLRNSLTTLGVAVGVASLVAMLSLGVGLQTLADERLNRSGIFDTVLVYSRRDIPSFDRSERRALGRTDDARRLDLAARREMEALPNVKEVHPEVRFAIEARFNDAGHFTTVAGLPLSGRENEAFDTLQGTYFTGEDADEAILLAEFASELLRAQEEAAADAAVLDAAKSGEVQKDAPQATDRNIAPAIPGVAPPKPPLKIPTRPPSVVSLLGKTITLRYAERVPLSSAGVPPANSSSGDRRSAGVPPANSSNSAATTTTPENRQQDAGATSDWGFSVLRRERQMRIIGIVETEPFGGVRSFARGRLFIPIGVAEKLNAMQSSSLRDPLRITAEKPGETIYASLLVRVSNPVQVEPVQAAIKKMGFTTWSILDAARNMRIVFAIFDTFLGVFGSLALAVASLGIVNTLVMAILERRREIGIMKALGASDRDIKQIFFAEAGAMGLAGGAFGVLLGWAIGRVIDFGTNIWLARQELPEQHLWLVPWWLVAAALAFSVLVSLAAGLYPAARAAKLDPVQALRYE